MKLTGNLDKDAKKLEEQHKRTAKKHLKVIEEVKPKLKKAKADYKSANQKYERRKARAYTLTEQVREINDEIDKITATLRKKLRAVEERRRQNQRDYNTYKWQVRNLSAEISKHKEHIDQAQIALGGKTLKMTRKKKAENKQLLEQLYKVFDLIDTTQPVDYRPSWFRWTTKPIYIKDRDGLDMPHNFGRFRFTVRKDKYGSLRVACTSVDNPDMSYPHPHLQRRSACLGNASAQFRKSLTNGNIADAIMIGNEYLTSYNKYSPYRGISGFQKGSLWDNAWCACKTLPKYRCGCAVCRCGQLIEDQNRPCGCCETCCSKLHRTVEEGWGINGSTCTLKKLTHR